MISRADQAGDSRAWMARWEKPGQPPRYVSPETMCLFPRLGHRLRAVRDGDEFVLPCRDCPGCRELEAKRLAKRLVETYRQDAMSGECQETSHKQQSVKAARGQGARLFSVRIDAPLEMHATMSRRIHRLRGVDVEPGFFRAGLASFIVLSRSPSALEERLRKRGQQCQVRPIGKLNRLRSWREIVRGLIVARSAYGENVNRFYARGLARGEKLGWGLIKLAQYHAYHRAEDPRATTDERGRLMPPKMWKLQRGVRVRVHNILKRATSPEAVTSIMPGLRELISKVGRPLVDSAVPKTPEEIERSRRAYQHVARLETARTDDPSSEKIPPPIFQEEVTELLANSESFEERKRRRFEAAMRAPPTVESWMEEEERRRRPGEQASRERSDQILKKRLDDAFARLRELVKRRKNEQGD